MPDDIFKDIREEILKEDADSYPWVPKHLNRSWETQVGIAGALTGVLGGFAAGTHLGLAGPWGLIGGTIPCAVAGGVIGYFAGSKTGSQFQRGSKPAVHKLSQSYPSQFFVRESRQIEANLTCPNCGAKKTTVWDRYKNTCSACGRQFG